MNRRTFITNLIAVGAVLGLVGAATKEIFPITINRETFTFPLNESSLKGLLAKLVKQPNQRIVVVMAPHSMARTISDIFEVTGKATDLTTGKDAFFTVTTPNNTKIDFFDINRPEVLKGVQCHSSIIVGESKYGTATRDMLKFGTRLGEAPTIFELKN